MEESSNPYKLGLIPKRSFLFSRAFFYFVSPFVAIAGKVADIGNVHHMLDLIAEKIKCPFKTSLLT